MFSFWKKKRSLKSQTKYEKEQHPKAKLKKVLNIHNDSGKSIQKDVSDTSQKTNTLETVDLSDPPTKRVKQTTTSTTSNAIKSIAELTPTAKRNNYTQVRISPLNLRKENVSEVSNVTDDKDKPKVIKMTLKYIEQPKQIEYLDKNYNQKSIPAPVSHLQTRRIEKYTNNRPNSDIKLLHLNLGDKKTLNVSPSPPKPRRTFDYNQINGNFLSNANTLPKTAIEKQISESQNSKYVPETSRLSYNNNDLDTKINDTKKHMSYHGSLKTHSTNTGDPKIYKSTFNTVLSRPQTPHSTTFMRDKEPSDIFSKTKRSNLESGYSYEKRNLSLLDCGPVSITRSTGMKSNNIPRNSGKYLDVPIDEKMSKSSSCESLCAKLRSTGIKTSSGSVGKKYYKFGERGSGTKSRTQPQDFYRLRDSCLSNGTLFEDPDFPPVNSSLYFSKSPDRHFEWRRPSEIVGNPQLFVEGFSRFDVQQGELGDCWLLAAVANLTLSRKLFFQIVPDDQSFVEKYAGIFHFRFWQYGRWIDVVIDDRLPTYRGRLVFLHSSEANEFWSALLEKAYAKLHGSYEALKGGSTCEAMEDFTGGVTEMYELHDAPPNLFTILLKGYERNSLMGCSIEPDPSQLEAETPEGLIKGHAYSITRVKYVDIQTPNSVGKIPLIRVRNPWGNEAEWKGAWSDKSPEWRFISDSDKEELGLTFDDDGEFWMSYRDFQKYFDRLEICNLSPDSLTDEDIEIGKKKWEVSVFEGDWVRGVTAGGCRNFLESFWHNPQYNITLTEVDDDDDDNKCTVIIALMQKNRRALRNTGADCLTIGFAIYYLPNPDRVPKPLNLNFFKYNASVARSPSFINLREVSCRFRLPRGTYCIVPSTFEPNEEAEFLLRVFSENKNHMEENDEDVGTCNMDDRIVEEPEPTPQADDKVREFFLRLAGEDMEVDWMELKEILDYAMRNELPAYKRIDAESGVGGNESGSDCGSILMNLLAAICSVACKDTPLADMFSQSNDTTATPYQPAGIIETENKGFSKDICRSMIAMMDKDSSGKLGFEEFKKLWIDIRNWKAVFKLYDKDQSGVLSAFELREALNSAGYKLNNHVLGTLVHRYGTKDGYIAFDDFIMCAVKLKTMIDNPDEYNRFMNEGAQLSYGGYGYNYT